MLDENNYPDKTSLEEISNWRVFDKGIVGLLNLVEENTNWADRQISQRGKRVIYYQYHTGGWSGNEDVIEALSNTDFWFLFWQKSFRGGHYYFKITHPEWYPLKRVQRP